MIQNRLWRKFIANISRENAANTWSTLTAGTVAGALTGGYVGSFGVALAIIGISCLAGMVVMVAVIAAQIRWRKTQL